MIPLLIIAVAVVLGATIIGSIWSEYQRANRDDADELLPPSVRLRFRRPARAHRAELLTLARDADTIAANGWDEATIAKSEAMLRSRVGFAMYRKSAIVAVERSSGAVVGVATASAKQPIGDKPEWSIGLQTSVAHRNQGYGRELMVAAIVVYRRLTDTEVWVGTATTNLAIQRIMEQVGYVPEPETEPYTAPNGEVFESLWYRCGRLIPLPEGPAAGDSSP